MIHWRRGLVLAVLAERPGFQEIKVRTEEGEGHAVVLTELTGAARPGDDVILNVTAVSLGLGTGGKHFVAAVPGRLPPDPAGPGHLMKLRYTPFQLRCAMAEENEDIRDELSGQVVVVGELHSQLLPVAATLRRELPPGARLVYLMTDGGALPMAFSDTVASMRARGLLDATVTIGHAFGGDREAFNIYAGLLVARHDLRSTITLVMMGPGVAGSNSRFGHTAVEQAINADAVSILGGQPVIVPRLSCADQRPRHQGLSHHTLTVCGRLTQRRSQLPLPILPGSRMDLVMRQVAGAGLHLRHDLQLIDAARTLAYLAETGLAASTMGRGPGEDPDFFLAAGAAAMAAAALSQ